MQTRALMTAGLLVIACGPLPPVGGSGESATEGGETTGGPTTEGPTTEGPTSGPTSGTTTTEPETSSSGSTTLEPDACKLDSDCGGECSYCINGACEYSPGCCGLMPGPGGELELRCIGYECYGDEECSDGEFCENSPGWCSPIAQIPQCEAQALTLSSLALQGTPSAVALLDVDGDGDLDLVATLPDAGLVEVALGDGAGGFSPGATFPTKLEPGAHRIAWADFDGDGDPDLAISRPVPAGELALLFGQDAMFADPVLLTLGSSPAAVWAGDVDGDGKADVLAHNLEGPAPLTLRLGDGLGGFGDELGGDQLIGESFAAAAGDIDDDGILEVVTSFGTESGIRTLFFTNQQFVAVIPQAVPGDLPQEALIVGAIDGEPARDIAGFRFAPEVGGLVSMWTSPELTPSELAVEGTVQLGPVADVDGDGTGDLVTLAAEPALVRVIYTGAERCVQAFMLPGPSSPELLAAGDVDGDGEADVIAGSFAGASVAILRSGP